MPLGHNKGTELPTLRERLLARRSDDAFIGASMLFNPDGPEAAAMLQTAAEALQYMPDEIEVFRIMQRTGGKRADMAKAVGRRIEEIRCATLERLNQ